MAGGIVQTNNTGNTFMAGYEPWAELQMRQKSLAMNNALLQQKLDQTAQIFPLERQQIKQQLQMGEQHLQEQAATSNDRVQQSHLDVQRLGALVQSQEIANKYLDGIEQAKTKALQNEANLGSIKTAFAPAQETAALNHARRQGEEMDLSTEALRAGLPYAKQQAKQKFEMNVEALNQEKARTQALKDQSDLMAAQLRSHQASLLTMTAESLAKLPQNVRAALVPSIAQNKGLEVFGQIPTDDITYNGVLQALRLHAESDPDYAALMLMKEAGVSPTDQIGMQPTGKIDAKGNPEMRMGLMNEKIKEIIKKSALGATDKIKGITRDADGNPTAPQPKAAVGVAKDLSTSSAAVSQIQGQAASSSATPPSTDLLNRINYHINQHPEVNDRPMSGSQDDPATREFLKEIPTYGFFKNPVAGGAYSSFSKGDTTTMYMKVDKATASKDAPVNVTYKIPTNDYNLFKQAYSSDIGANDPTAKPAQTALYKGIIEELAKNTAKPSAGSKLPGEKQKEDTYAASQQTDPIAFFKQLSSSGELKKLTANQLASLKNLVFKMGWMK